jgi:endonuclease/exonuclease/phosphatase (EEP) superfamily protein YafD
MSWTAFGLLLSWLILAYVMPQDLRNTTSVYGILVYVGFVARVLHFHLAIASAILAMLALLLRERKLALLTGILSFVLFWPTLISMFPKSPAPAAGPTVRVMSINLLASNRNGEVIVKQIRAANPDVIAIQEYSSFADELLRQELTDYPHRLTEPDPVGTSGMAIFSKVPIRPEVSNLKNYMDGRKMRAVLQIGGRDVVFYDIHPTSPSFINSVLRNRVQTADLIEELQEEPRPIIIAGDLNATETTANLAAYREMGLSSTHDLAGFGRGTTWPSTSILKYLPGFRIDHIFISKELTCTHSEVCGQTGSDHRPIVADIALAGLK